MEKNKTDINWKNLKKSKCPCCSTKLEGSFTMTCPKCGSEWSIVDYSIDGIEWRQSKKPNK